MTRHAPLKPARRDHTYSNDYTFEYPSSYTPQPRSSGCGCFGVVLIALLIIFGYIFITLAIKGLFN